MLCAGCEYSSSSETKTSVSVEEGGKVKSTSTVYAERVENGKTTNHSATMSVDKGNVKLTTANSNAPQAKTPLSYTVEDADLNKGEVKIFGFLSNDNKETVKIKNVTISYTFYDNNGKVICRNESEVIPVNVSVAPNSDETLDLIINDPTAPNYKDGFDMKYTLTYE